MKGVDQLHIHCAILSKFGGISKYEQVFAVDRRRLSETAMHVSKPEQV